MDSLLATVLVIVVTLTVQMIGIAYRLDRKLSSLKSRQASLESRLEDLKAWVDKDLKAWVDKELKAYVDGKFSEVDRRFSEMVEKLSRGLSLIYSTALVMHALAVDFAALKGLFTEEERDYLKAQLSSIASMIRLNPEEAEFVRRVVSKPEKKITKEELDKLVEIAKRYFFFENPGELSAMFFHYAYAYRAALLYGRRERESVL